MEPKNPFMEMVKNAMQRQGQPQQNTVGAKPAMVPQVGQSQGMQMPPQQSQYERGVNPGNTKFLIGAVQSLEKYITESTNRDEIATARGIIALLSRLIAKDQEDMSGEDEE